MDKTDLETLLAFDYGTQKIGCAVGNMQLQTSSPLELVNARNGVPNWDQITGMVTEWQPDAMVIGLPDNMDGSNSVISERAKKFSRQLKERYRVPCFLMDERLTSFEARDHLNTVNEVRGRSGKTAKKSRKGPAVDAVAAQLILQSWYRAEDRLPV
jgi:putative Holliday junction resolvase